MTHPDPIEYGKPVAKLVRALPLDAQAAYLAEREAAYQRIRSAYLAGGLPEPRRSVLSGEP